MSSENEPELVSATGPDGAGKDTAWKNALPLLPHDLRILKIGKPSSVIINGDERYVDVGMSHRLDWLHSWADTQRSKTLTSIANTMYVMFQWRIQEPVWTRRIHPDLVFSLRDGYVDPAAYAPYYTPQTLGKLPIPDRIDTLYRLHHSPFRHHTIFLDVDPAVAVRRIEERMEREKEAQGLVRPKWVHQHENLEDLTGIRAEYGRVLAHMKAVRNTRISTIDTTNQPRETIGLRLAQEILTNLPYVRTG